MNEQMDDSESSNGQQTTAVSLFSEAGTSGDFPVLKAFQQYIDAEQAKARKRMVWLSAFFVTVLVIVVVVFAFIMAAVISRDQKNLSEIATRNQELSDKLLNIALKQQQPAQTASVVVPAQPQPASDVVLKPVLDKLENLATAMNARPQQQESRPADPAATLRPVLEKLENLTSAMAIRPQQQPIMVAPVAPTPQLTQADREAAQLRETLRQLQAEMKADQAKAAKAEKERLHKEEVERHRRRLYPEYYAREDARKKSADAGRAPTPLPPATTAPGTEQPATATKPAPTTSTEGKAAPALPQSTPSSPKAIQSASSSGLTRSERQNSHFEEEDEDLKKLVQQTSGAPEAPSASKQVESKPAALPSPAAEKQLEPKAEETKAPAKAETLHVGAKSGEGVPFVIELPEAK